MNKEFGRTLSLKDIPHLKYIVVKNLTSPAKEAAKSNGFLFIELKEKAT
ncbi:hypothetical protein, partial [Caldisphaera sp.]